MSRFIASRLAAAVPVLLGATLVVFVLIQLAPGDPTATLLGPTATGAEREALSKEMGLDKPLPVQYVKWLANVGQGDLGTSTQLRLPVMDILLRKFRNTLILGIASAILAIGIGTFIGVVSAVRRDSLVDRLGFLVTMGGISIPPYWLSIVVIYLFALKFRWLPTGLMHSVTGDRGWGDLLRHMVLPTFVAAAAPGAIMARVSRAAMLEVLQSDFLTAMRAQGLPESRILYRRAFKNALPGIVNMAGLQFGYLLLGTAVFVEIVFQWPGVGLAIKNAVSARDFPLTAGIVLASSFIFLTINLIVDVVTAWIDPRARV